MLYVIFSDPPYITSCKDNIVEEGSSLFWQCSANGSEPLSTSWHRGNNTAVVQSGKSLTISNVSRADGGLYTFKASNGEGCAAASKTVQLDVQCKYIDSAEVSLRESLQGVLVLKGGFAPPLKHCKCCLYLFVVVVVLFLLCAYVYVRNLIVLLLIATSSLLSFIFVENKIVVIIIII